MQLYTANVIFPDDAPHARDVAARLISSGARSVEVHSDQALIVQAKADDEEIFLAGLAYYLGEGIVDDYGLAGGAS